MGENLPNKYMPEKTIVNGNLLFDNGSILNEEIKGKEVEFS